MTSDASRCARVYAAALARRNVHAQRCRGPQQERESFLREGRAISRQRQEELDRLAQIKAAKVRELQEAGVPHKYIVELERFDPEKALVQDYKRGGKVKGR